jgi:hypothetical protein
VALGEGKKFSLKFGTFNEIITILVFWDAFPFVERSQNAS